MKLIPFMSRCRKNMNNLVLSLAPKFTNLQTLILRQDMPQLEDNAVEAVAQFCRDLQILDLSKSFKLTDRSLYAIALGCSDLTKLNISGCSSFSDNALSYLASLCRKLKILNLCGCVKAVSDTALQVWVWLKIWLYFIFVIEMVYTNIYVTHLCYNPSIKLFIQTRP